jgi:hypothetical protein
LLSALEHDHVDSYTYVQNAWVLLDATTDLVVW